MASSTLVMVKQSVSQAILHRNTSFVAIQVGKQMSLGCIHRGWLPIFSGYGTGVSYP